MNVLIFHRTRANERVCVRVSVVG